MPTGRFALAAISVAAFLPAPALAQATFTGAGQHAQLDCDAGEAHITGAGNVIDIGRACTKLVVEGADNTITIDLAAKSAITVVGASNRIRWHAPAQAKPRLSITGADNSVTRLK